MPSSVHLTPTERALINHLVADGREHLDLKLDRCWLEELSSQPALVIHKLRGKGVLHTVQRGRYVLNTDGTSSRRPILRSLDPLAPLVLSRLDHDYYLSWHSSLWHHGLLDQQSQRLLVAVTARKRPAVHGRLQVRFVTVRPERFFGAELVEVGGASVKVASVSKALVDALDRPSLAAPVGIVGGALRAAWRAGKLDPEALVGDALRYGSPALNRRLGWFMDFYEIPGSDGLRAHLGRQWAVSLQPGGTPDLKQAAVASRWRVWPDPDVVAVAASQR